MKFETTPAFDHDYRIPLADPAAFSVMTKLSPNPLNVKLLDDLTVVGDNIYRSASGPAS